MTMLVRTCELDGLASSFVFEKESHFCGGTVEPDSSPFFFFCLQAIEVSLFEYSTSSTRDTTRLE